ncbi:hypothetical protein MMC12_002917 [Toensbergia leucococca]|nr:hypothetical protein [Toensbergia leucococca]
MTSRSGLSNSWRVKSDNNPVPNNQPLQTSIPTKRYDQSYRNKGLESTHQSNPLADRLIRSTQSNGDNPDLQIRGEDDPKTLQAIEEGRRLYVGNMPYMAKPEDVEALFTDGGYPSTYINMSIDPFTGRNPSYCFVELPTKDDADRAMQILNGKIILGRPVKLGPSVVRTKTKPWTAKLPSRDVSFQRWTRTDAANRWKGEEAAPGCRLFVGGLPLMAGHDMVDAQVRAFFVGYNVLEKTTHIFPNESEAVSKVVIPPGHNGGNDRYLFVDFPNADEATKAMDATNGKTNWGVKVRVNKSRSYSKKVEERERYKKERDLA